MAERRRHGLQRVLGVSDLHRRPIVEAAPARA
jgi:hypothetical protein